MTNSRYRHSSVKLVVGISPDTLEEVGGERQVWSPAQTAADKLITVLCTLSYKLVIS